MTFSGLCDMMLLGNVCELGLLLQRRFYERGTISDVDVEECRMAGWRYRQFQTWFQSTHVLVVDGRLYEPLAAFRWSLVHFTAAICWHKYRYNKVVPHDAHFTSTNLLHVFGCFFQQEYPELFDTWKEVADRKIEVFHWNGPKFEIRKRTNGEVDVLGEVQDFDMWDQTEAKGSQVDSSSNGKKRKRSTTLGE